MTFKVSRTSQWHFEKDKPPCKNASATVEEYEFKVRVFDETGKRIWQSNIRKKDIWTIEINTLEELMELKKEVNEDGGEVGLIIFDDEETPSIEIYDDYRE